jgi:hypothetical protein
MSRTPHGRDCSHCSGCHILGFRCYTRHKHPIIYRAHTRDGFRSDTNRSSFGIRVWNAPEIDDPVINGDIKKIRMCPRLRAQMCEQFVANGGIRKRYVELASTARDGLDKIGAAYDSNKTTIADERNPLMPFCSIRAAISSREASGDAVMTRRVITSLILFA